MLLLLLLLAFVLSAAIALLTGRLLLAILFPVIGAGIWSVAIVEGDPSWAAGLFILMGGFFAISSGVGASVGKWLHRNQLDRTDKHWLAGGTAVVVAILLASIYGLSAGNDVEGGGREFACSHADVLALTGKVRSASVYDRMYRGGYVRNTEVEYYRITYLVLGDKGEYLVEVGMEGHPSAPRFELVQVKRLT